MYTYPPIKWVKPKATSADSVEMGFYLRSNPVISEVANSMLNAARMNQQFFTDGASSEQPGSSGLLRGNNSRTTLYVRGFISHFLKSEGGTQGLENLFFYATQYMYIYDSIFRLRWPRFQIFCTYGAYRLSA